MMNLICNICNSKDVYFFTEKNSCRLCKCRKCGLIFVDNAYEEAKIYSEDYFVGAKEGFGYVNYEKDKSAMDWTFKAYLKQIEKFLPGKGRLLDVGAATGYFLERAKQAGWEVAGVEISEYASSKAREKGLKVINGTLKDLKDSKNSFDAMTFLDSIEHLPNARADLLIARKLLKKDGIIVINTPDAGSLLAKILGRRWQHLVPPEHLAIFNQKNLAKLLKECGFKVLFVDKIGKKFTLQYIAHVISIWSKLKLALKLADSLRNNSLGNIAMPLNLRDNFFVIARKV